jgi:uncharacterized protein YndB with AHSA1/START domain
MNQQRNHETVIEIAAPAELVWKAISEADEIVHWFAPQAKVEPGPDGSMVGGTVWLSWGEGVEGTSRIEIWEPGKRLRTVTEREGAYDIGTARELASESGPVRVYVDYFIEANGGMTVLRLVHSGFGRGANWDREYDATRKGWPIMFRVLKYNLEAHPGEAVRQVSITMPVDTTPEQTWARLLDCQLDGLQRGDRYSLRMPTGDVLEGTIDDNTNRGYLTAVVENWNRALMGIYSECRKGGSGLLTVGFILYGPMAEQAQAIENRWRQMLQQRFASVN